MKIAIAFAVNVVVACLLTNSVLLGQKISESFEFQFEKKTLKGLIERPQHHTSSALIIIIPGYGRTDFVEGNWYSDLRDKFVEYGLTVCFWDKMGCGNSEGNFDAQQPVNHSADEAIAAIQEIKRLKIPGSDKIGLWGISRAGWICPLINEQFPIDFWISVSGTDDKENFGYLVKSNLIINGKEEEEAERLFQGWMLGHKLYCTYARYKKVLKAIQPLREDSTCRKLFGYTKPSKVTQKDKQNFKQERQLYTQRGYFDRESGLWVYLDNFDELLGKMNCPVLALFGENDSQVDWRKTRSLYESTLGTNPGSELTLKTFDNCNHNLQKCVTCGYQEDLSALNWQACDGYYETMKEWLKKYNLIDQ